MKWIFAIKYKLKAAAILSIILFIVFSKNVMDGKNRDELGSTFISVYEDRLVVENYIFKISEELFKIRLCLANSTFSEQELLAKIENTHLVILGHINEVEKTKLTEKEAFYLNDLKSRVESVIQLEMELAASSTDSNLLVLEKYINDSLSDLEVLSEIQLEEGKKLVSESEKIVLSSAKWDQLELVILCILLVIIYILIFVDFTLNKKVQSQFSLN